jgi:hypothetical protein
VDIFSIYLKKTYSADSEPLISSAIEWITIELMKLVVVMCDWGGLDIFSPNAENKSLK